MYSFFQISSHVAPNNFTCVRSMSSLRPLAGFPLLSSHVKNEESLIPSSTPLLLPSRCSQQSHVEYVLLQPFWFFSIMITLLGARRNCQSWTKSCMVGVTMEVLTMATRSWTGIEKVNLLSTFHFMEYRTLIINDLVFQVPMCANESLVQTLLATTSPLPRLWCSGPLSKSLRSQTVQTESAL